MTYDAKPLSLRHERFVAEYLKDANATRAYIRAGYSPRGAQPSASRLLRRPGIEAAIAAGRQRLAQALVVTAERLTQEYAKIAFASVDDFVSVDDDGRLLIDLEKAGQAQRAGIVELRVSNNHSNQEQRVTLKLGKLQALAALTKQLGGLAAKPKPEATVDGTRLLHQAEERAQRLERELAEARAVLAVAEAEPKASGHKASGPKASGIENPNPSIFPVSRRPADRPRPQPRLTVMPGMPSPMPPDSDLDSNATFTWN